MNANLSTSLHFANRLLLVPINQINYSISQLHHFHNKKAASTFVLTAYTSLYYINNIAIKVVTLYINV